MRETIRPRPLVLLALLASIVMTSGCRLSANPTPSPSGNAPPKATFTNEESVAQIGDISISRQQLMDRLFATYGSQSLRNMMLNVVVNEEAKALGIQVTEDEIIRELLYLRQGYEDEENFYEAMEEQLGMSRADVRDDARYRLLLEKLSVHNVDVSQEEIDRYLEEHYREFEPSRQVELAHLVVESEQEAAALLAQLTAGAEFEELALMHSIDEFTADSGGELGWVDSQDPFVAPEVLQAVGSMDVGEVKGPIRTDQGYVIVQLNGRKDLEVKTKEEIQLEVWRQIALSKAVSMRELEQVLLEKYNARVLEPSLRE